MAVTIDEFKPKFKLFHILRNCKIAFYHNIIYRVNEDENSESYSIFGHDASRGLSLVIFS
jgi:hypothetical protein